MLDWKNQPIELLNEAGFSVTDPGPLHGPVIKLSARRDCRLTLLIDTEAGEGATSNAQEITPGTVRENFEKVELTNEAGATATLTGVSRLRSNESALKVRQISRIQELIVSLPAVAAPAYTIEWIDNLPTGHSWPHDIEIIDGPTTGISFAKEIITVVDPKADHLGSGQAVIIEVAGHRLGICAPTPSDDFPTNKSGCFIYESAPDELTRKKIRTALSFAFGVYLVETGHTIFDIDCRVISATAKTAYALGHKALELTPMPLIWASDHNAPLHISAAKLTRLVERFVAVYETLGLADLSWAYWHARTAPPHTAPAQFGAAIEALQDACIKLQKSKIKTSILPHKDWQALRSDITKVIEAAPISDDAKAAFIKKILDNMNSVPQRDLLKSVCDTKSVAIGKDESDAWRRRNKAAHGVAFPYEETLPTIRDMKLLMVLFHRMLLGMSGADDTYIDWATMRMPNRPLSQAVPSVDPAATK